MSHEDNSIEKPELVTPAYSGFLITDFGRTWEMADAIGEAWMDYRSGEGTLSQCIASHIKELPGIEVIDDRCEADDEGYRCAHHIFGVILEEPWATPGSVIPNAIFSEGAFKYLSAKGYCEISGPAQPGDVVVYCWGNDNPNHYGIYEGDRRVVSKFGKGPIVQHDLTQAIEEGTTKIRFIRKAR